MVRRTLLMMLSSSIVVGVLTSGCTSHIRTPLVRTDDRYDPTGLEASLNPAFEYPKAEVGSTNHVIRQGATPGYELRELQIPSIGENAQAENLIGARFFRSLEPGPRPLVIVLPIWARYTYPSRKMCRYIQKHSGGGVHVLDVQGVRFLIDWEELAATTDEDEFMERWRMAAERERVTMVDIRRLLDWAEQHPDIDGSRVAILGFSHSAIIAGTVVTQEPRLAAAVLVMGGAHPHRIIARCRGKRTSAVQKNAENAFGWGREEFEKRLEPVFRTVDAASYPGRVDPNDVLILDSGRDKCIPESCRDALWDALGRPERISFNYGHRMSFLSMTPLGGSWMCRRIWDFLETRLLARGE